MTQSPTSDGNARTTSVEPDESRRFLIIASKAAGYRAETLAEMGRWLDALPHPGRPIPKDRACLVRNADGTRLHVPGQPPLKWHPGTAYLRLRDGDDPLPGVMGLRMGETVLDATLGMGHDCLLLAHAGARVLAMDLCPALIFFTFDGIRRFSPEIARRISVRCVDHRQWLRDAPTDAVDHVYLDPMFPESVGGASHTWSVLRAFAVGPRLAPDTLRDACRVARRTVVMKLAPYEPPLRVPGLPDPVVRGSKRVHFGVWHCGGTN